VPITLCVASQRVFIAVSIYFVIDSVRKLLDTPSYILVSPDVKIGGSSEGTKSDCTRLDPFQVPAWYTLHVTISI